MGMFDMGIGGLAKGFSSFMNPGKAYKRAGQQMDKYYQQGQEALNPYMQQGQAAYEPMQNAMQSLLDPTALQGQWIDSYEQSPWAQDLMSRSMSEGQNAASAMGLLGSSPALQALQAGSAQIGNADRQAYLDDIMKKYMSGAQVAQGIYGQGANAASQFGQNAMNQGQQMGQMAYGQQAAPGQMFGNLLNTAISAAVPMYGMSQMAKGGGGWNTGGGMGGGSYNPMGGGNRIGGY